MEFCKQKPDGAHCLFFVARHFGDQCTFKTNRVTFHLLDGEAFDVTLAGTMSKGWEADPGLLKDSGYTFAVTRIQLH